MSESGSIDITGQRLSDDGQASRRKRLVHSCEECRRRKIKCDRKEPCCHCVLSRKPCIFKKRVATCHSQKIPVNVWRAKARSFDTPVMVQRIDGCAETTETGSLHTHRSRATIVGSLVTEGETVNASTDAIETTHHPSATNQASKTRISNSVHNDPSNDTVPETSKELRASLELDQEVLMLNKSRLFGRSHWSTGNHEVGANLCYLLLVL